MKKTKMANLILFVLLTVSQVTFMTVHANIWLSRQNYGVIFEDIGLFDSGKSKWYQTFVVELNKVNIQDYKHPCQNSFMINKWSSKQENISTDHMQYWYTDVPNDDEISLEHFCPSFLSYEHHHNVLRQRIEQTRQRIGVMLPRYSPRKRRGLFNFIGEASKSLFGTATEDDIKAVKEQIAHMTATTADMKGQLVFLGNSLQSYILKENKQDEYLRNAIRLQHEQNNMMIHTFTNSLRNVTNNLMFWMNVMHIFHTDFTVYLDQLEKQVQQELVGVTKLFEGYLSPELIEPDLMTFTLSHIQEELKEKFPDFSITHTHPAFYYNRQDVTFVRINNSIHITLSVPIHSEPSTFRLYEIHTLPVPVPNEESYFTVLNIDRPYLAVNEDQTLYVLMTMTQYLSCSGTLYKQCTNLMSTLNTETDSCELSLFLDHPDKISKLCRDKYKIIQNSETYIAKLSDRVIISTPDKTIIQSCLDGNISKIQNCKFCTVVMKCGCSLKGSSFYIPPKITDCENNTEIIVNHAINLPLLHEFYKEYDYLFNISATQVYQFPVITDIPKFKILEKKFDGVTQESEKLSMSLKQTALRIKARNEVFRDKVSQFSNEFGYLTNTTLQILFIIILTITTLSAHVALFCSLRNWYILYAMIHHVKAKSLILGTSSTTLPIEGQFEIESELQSVLTVTSLTFCSFMLVIMIFLIWMLIYCYSRLTNRRDLTELPFNTTVYIIFYQAHECISVPLLTSCANAKDLVIQEMSPFMRNMITLRDYWFRTQMNFDWSFVKLQNNSARSQVALPSKIMIDRFQSVKFKEMIARYGAIKIVAKQNGNYYELFSHEIVPANIERPERFYEQRALFREEPQE